MYCSPGPACPRHTGPLCGPRPPPAPGSRAPRLQGLAPPARRPGSQAGTIYNLSLLEHAAPSQWPRATSGVRTPCVPGPRLRRPSSGLRPHQAPSRRRPQAPGPPSFVGKETREGRAPGRPAEWRGSGGGGRDPTVSLTRAPDGSRERRDSRARAAPGAGETHRGGHRPRAVEPCAPEAPTRRR